jgi:hypothetical protein
MVVVVLLSSIVMVRFSVLFGDTVPTWATVLPTVIFTFGIALLVSQRPRLHTTTGALILFGAYVGLVCVSFLRAAISDTVLTHRGAVVLAVQTALLAALFAIALLSTQDATTRRRRWLAVAFAPVVYVAANVALRIAGVEPPVGVGDGGTAPAQLLGFLGIYINRSEFPLESGINQFGAIAGLALTMSSVLALKLRGALRLPALVGVLCSFYGVLAVDNRASLLFAVAAIATVLLVPRALQRGVSGLPLLLPVAPAIILGVLGVLAGTAFADVLSRGTGDFSTATGRGEVWMVIANFLSHPRLEHLWGYGAFGQITSEVSYAYAYVFWGYPHPEQATAHNFALQTILEIGYVGLVVALALFVRSIRGAVRLHSAHPSPESAAVLAGLLFIVGIGLTEAAPSAAHPSLFIAFLALAAATLRDLTPPALSRGSPPARDRNEAESRAYAVA